MLKQYVERQNVALHCLMSAEATTSVNEDDDTEEFSIDECALLTAKQPESNNDVSISETLTSEQRSEVEMLMERYPEVLPVYQVVLTRYSTISSYLRQDRLGRTVIPFRSRHVTSWRQKFKK